MLEIINIWGLFDAYIYTMIYCDINTEVLGVIYLA